MKVLSIDPSYSNCGVIVWEDGLLYDYFVIKTSNDSDEVVRLAHIIDTLKKVIKAFEYYLANLLQPCQQLCPRSASL